MRQGPSLQADPSDRGSAKGRPEETAACPSLHRGRGPRSQGPEPSPPTQTYRKRAIFALRVKTKLPTKADTIWPLSPPCSPLTPGSGLTGLPEALQTHQAHSHLRAFALAVPSAWNVLP